MMKYNKLEIVKDCVFNFIVFNFNSIKKLKYGKQNAQRYEGEMATHKAWRYRGVQHQLVGMRQVVMFLGDWHSSFFCFWIIGILLSFVFDHVHS